jgi:hypothetical protein
MIFTMIFSFFSNPPSLNPSSPATQQALQLVPIESTLSTPTKDEKKSKPRQIRKQAGLK